MSGSIFPWSNDNNCSPKASFERNKTLPASVPATDIRKVNTVKRNNRRAALSLVLALAATPLAIPSHAQGVLRIAMTAADIPTTTGTPNNGLEGVRFVGYPAFEGLVLWDLSKPDKPSDIRPGLAESWDQDARNLSVWTFHLRKGVHFHDGSLFDADAVVWNMDRFLTPAAKQYEPQAAAIIRGKVPHIVSWRKVDPYTFELTTERPISYVPYLLTQMLFASPTQFAKVGSWTEFALHPSGTGPFRITKVVPRISVELARFDGYWDHARIAKLDGMVLYPMPEATTRLAALRSGQVDWIEVPPPDAIPSLKAAGFQITTGIYPHIWPWIFDVSKPDSPFRDVRVRRAANYCIDRKGVVTLLNGTAKPARGFYDDTNPLFGKPTENYTYEPQKSLKLLADAGYGAAKPVRAKIMISTAGSGQMLPVPMNELLQQQMHECGFDISFEVVDWGTLLVALRSAPSSPQARGANALNVSLVSSDVSQMARFFLKQNQSPNGSNWGHWENEAFEKAFRTIEGSRSQTDIAANTTKAHEILVDDAPWLYVVHDLNARAMTSHVKGFVSANSWFQDFTRVSMTK